MKTAQVRRTSLVAWALGATLAALHASAQPRAVAETVSEIDGTAPVTPVPQAPVTQDTGATSASSDTQDSAPSPADEQAATRALGTEEADTPDPVAEEGERTGSAEGEPLPSQPLPAIEIAALSDRACLRALQRARVPFERVRQPVAGVATPIRITGPINGVRYRASDRREIHELMDCRLAVALVRFSRMLRRLGIVEVVHYSIYRPPSASAVQQQPLQSRHGGGLAIDAAWFVREDGERFSVLHDFHGRRGRPVCGPEARVPHHDAARLLRSIACDAARRGFFHVVLTPNYNRPHRNHFHLEVTRNASWQVVR